MRKGNIVVTGGSGNLGSQTIRELLCAEYDVLNLDTVEPSEKLCEFRACDLSRATNLCDTFRQIDGVIHLAGYQAPNLAVGSEIIRNNVTTSYNVLKAATEAKVRRVVMGSSVAAYGFLYANELWRPDYLPLDEEHPCVPKDPYALSKVFGEQLADSFVLQGDLSVVSLRLSGVNLDLVFASLPERWANPGAKLGSFWSYVDLRDAGAACRLAVEAHITGHEVFNIAAETSRYLEPTTELVERYLPGTRIKSGMSGNWSGLDSSRAKSHLGFEARHIWETYIRPDGTPA